MCFYLKAAVFSLSEAVQRQRQTPPLARCQPLVTNDAAALSSANWPDKDGSGPSYTMLRLLAAAFVCFVVLMFSFTAALRLCTVSFHRNFTLGHNTVRLEKTQTKLEREWTPSLEAVCIYSTPLFCMHVWEDNKCFVKVFLQRQSTNDQQLMSFKDPTVSAAECEMCVWRLWLAALTGLLAWGLWFILTGRESLWEWPWPINNRTSVCVFVTSVFSLSHTHTYWFNSKIMNSECFCGIHFESVALC